MSESLRTKQKRLARDAVVEALAGIVAASGSFEFSVSEVAAAAGVSPRTVYNHFGDRQGLIVAVADYAQRAMEADGATDLPETLAELPDRIAPNFRAMEANAELIIAFDTLGERASLGGSQRRTQRVVELVRDAHPDIPVEKSRAAAISIRQQASSTNWFRLTRVHGLSLEEAIEVAAWSVRLQVEALGEGDLP